MAFREKIAWLTLGSMLVAYTIYFSLLAARFDPAASQLKQIVQMLVLFGSVTLVQLIVVVIGSSYLAIRARRDAQDKPDERDRAIARRGTYVGYFVLMVGTILAGVVMPFNQPRWAIINASLAAIVVAEAVKYVLVIVSYRRGWHG